jgi:hypothetical protein
MTPKEQMSQANDLPLPPSPSNTAAELDASVLENEDLQRLQWYMVNGFHEEQFAALGMP